MASVTFKRGTRAEIEATAKQDGQILMETDQNKKNQMYIDLIRLIVIVQQRENSK